MSQSQDFLINAKNLRLTMYLSLAIANILFGALYPDRIIVAAGGFAFFAMLTLAMLRPDITEKGGAGKKVFYFDK